MLLIISLIRKLLVVFFEVISAVKLYFTNVNFTNVLSQVMIGPNTSITGRQFANICWGDSWQGAKDLAVAVFGRNILATHSLTGQRSNAMPHDKQLTPALNQVKVIEMIGTVCFVDTVNTTVNVCFGR
jgi:hypothetical protein